MNDRFAIDEEFTEHRRHLPHWQQGGYSYFVTFRSRMGILPHEALALVKRHILHDHGRRYELFFGVIMPDHVHLLLRPLEKSEGTWYGLPDILRGIKGASARSINALLGRQGTVWQQEYFDRLIRDEKDLQEKWLYMWNNPIKARLVHDGEEYPFYVRPQHEGSAGRERTD